MSERIELAVFQFLNGFSLKELLKLHDISPMWSFQFLNGFSHKVEANEVE